MTMKPIEKLLKTSAKKPEKSDSLEKKSFMNWDLNIQTHKNLSEKH